MIISHRGYTKKAAEINTLFAFDAAIKDGAQGIECDLRLTGDGQAIVNHNRRLSIANKKILVHRYSLSQLKDMCKSSGQKIMTLDDLFEYAKQKQTQFFLELKNSSPILTESVIKKIKEGNLWQQIHVVGFPFRIKNALQAQSQYSKLQLGQLLYFPTRSYIERMKKSYCVFLGWLDEIPGNQALFQALLSPKKLLKVKNFLEQKGFNVKGGIVNNKKGLDFFRDVGITDIVTDKVSKMIEYSKQ
jgi:glycerophosphoryl diester phosphodiesterase